MTKLLEVQNLKKSYTTRNRINQVIRGMSFTIDTGEYCAIMGPSGSGKTTLLNIMAGIDDADSGSVSISDEDIVQLSKSEMTLYRRDHIGVVYQDFNLIDSLTVKENIALPMHLEMMEPEEIDESIEGVAQRLGIKHLLNESIYEISGGELQRAAICRAIINKPDILLADEPTGNLDSKSTEDVMKCFTKLNSENGITILMVTHDVFSASFCKKVIFLRDGDITHEIERGSETREQFYKKILTELDVQGDY